MKILQLLQDDNGMFSSTRLAFLVWGIGAFVVWAVQSFHNQILVNRGVLADIPESVLMVIAALMTGKVIQKFKETKVEETPKKEKDAG
ncbi:hypothetical protein AUJ95_04655 [Candidatus Desantisbacteria bacterium CG2_30_40_21]|uniref:Uncharacterized protein n=5 Tax=unclassified Candidatus Desantisiibacteriota TaxID=3106372 RepID=A0A2M7JE62_9BACT|nr:MAG: hypothetical protein AUJ95_04655 [Candidatus Desantisbacteria bacterium CG2_30_40_21]PIP41851.1 MAG: hypothetical protein COX18_02230 [Candidatus Desantisbacteria bacterium CG23_combo_of_CG06-09_8_20_14_all_40_23]PIX17699.1 MAG: hypothetical protein COZ71_01915 [Candidatus Desantisbacteria bacterium CG_4_8_14_3_um_filter_40_12]PIY18781.1 MAG: hypothetical protein COZ13_08790 [Candidatus Desantisbacteria bacterium CG_4_10_14_3_um_filter_40_18]PJB30347.1 MAG: hypothetical protein CO110_00